MARLKERAERYIRSHAERSYPHECCGFMYGSDTESGRDIVEILEVKNSQVENRERRFLVSPDDYLKAEQYAIEIGQELLGIYHSHPDHPSIPSEHDRKQAMPFFSYVIVSVLNGVSNKIQSWVLNPDFQFEEETLTLDNQPLK